MNPRGDALPRWQKLAQKVPVRRIPPLESAAEGVSFCHHIS